MSINPNGSGPMDQTCPEPGLNQQNLALFLDWSDSFDDDDDDEFIFGLHLPDHLLD